MSPEQIEAAMLRRVRGHLAESIAVKQACLDTVADAIAEAARLVLEAVTRGGKIVLFGNGGSAADAQHLAADFVGRFSRDRAPIPAVALTTDTSVITAVGNDFGFDQIFVRQVEALVHEGDAVIAISTSGRSENVIRAAEAARRARARMIALTGRDGGPLAGLADVAIRVPADNPARIQEAHIAIGHAICAIVDDAWAPTR